MNWIQGIQRAVDYVEANIMEEIDFEEAAKQAYASSTASKPSIASTIIRTARMNPSLNASRSVNPDSSLWQSLNFSKVSFCCSVSVAQRLSSFLHISFTSWSTLEPRIMYLSCGLMLP